LNSMTGFPESGFAIGYDYFGKLREIIDIDSYRSSFLLADENVFKLYSKRIGRVFDREISNNRLFTFPADEKSKTLVEVGDICGQMLERGVSEDAILIAIGGGAITDLAGLAAAIYRGGIDHVNVPTTLSGQIDVSVGGKCAVNIEKLKNVVGLFNPPGSLLIDPSFLDTLPRERIEEGTLRLLRIAAIADSDLLTALESIKFDFIGADDSMKLKLIERAARLKAAISAREKGGSWQGGIMGLGLITADAICAIMDIAEFSRGRALAVGVLTALELSEQMCGFGRDSKRRLFENIRLIYGNSLKISVDGDRLWTSIKYDKPWGGSEIKFTLLEEIGTPRTKTVYRDQFLAAYNDVWRYY